MKKFVKTGALAIMATLVLSSTAFAGTWKQTDGLACMTGYMRILRDHLGPLHGQFIDDSCNCLFIARDRSRA